MVFTELSALLIHEVSAILTASGHATEERATAIAEAVYFAYLGDSSPGRPTPTMTWIVSGRSFAESSP